MRIRMVAVAGSIAGAALLFAASAYAEDPMVNTYANTVVTTDEATGATSDLLFNRDNTYTAEATGKDGKPISMSGAWSLEDDGKTICMTPNAAAGGSAPPPTTCSPLDTHNVGDSWTLTNDQKETFKVSIKAGR